MLQQMTTNSLASVRCRRCGAGSARPSSKRCGLSRDSLNVSSAAYKRRWLSWRRWVSVAQRWSATSPRQNTAPTVWVTRKRCFKSPWWTSLPWCANFHLCQIRSLYLHEIPSVQRTNRSSLRTPKTVCSHFYFILQGAFNQCLGSIFHIGGTTVLQISDFVFKTKWNVPWIL